MNGLHLSSAFKNLTSYAQLRFEISDLLTIGQHMTSFSIRSQVTRRLKFASSVKVILTVNKRVESIAGPIISPFDRSISGSNVYSAD